MSYGARLLFPNGNPFYIQDTLPISLIYKRDVTFNNSTTTFNLDADGEAPYIYFIRMDNQQAYAYQDINSSSGQRYIVSGLPTNTSYSFNARIYCFGLAFQTPPKWGVAFWDAKGRCILTNETVTLKGLTKIGASGTAGKVDYLNESVQGKVAIIPGRTGQVTYRTGGASGGGGIAGESYATGCFYDSSSNTTKIKSTLASVPSGGTLVTSNGTNYMPAYIDCSLYD
ncbi:hypothetical protein [Rosenbergiella epipactidis]|uniref:hypothetical protein n=1 Tax=Rosenbergiella epipactidis TaxID=1544694 RepID=UPI001F4F0155|nr:hypothetical protein [Rosenbergiella epipactidis]